MAKVLSGGRRREQLPEIKKEETVLDQSQGFNPLRAAGGAASRAFESVGGLPGNILSLGLGATNYLTGGRTPTYEEFQKDRPLAPRTSAQIRSATKELSGSALEPKNKVERFVGDIGETLPMYIISGGALIPSIGKSIVTNLASTAARESGAGEVGQAVASIAGGLGFDAIRNRSAFAKLRPKNVLAIAKKEQDKDYALASKLSKGLREDATNLKNNIADEISNVYKASGLESHQEKEVLKQLEKVLDNVVADKINVKDAWDLKKHINSIYKNTSNIKIKNYYERVAGQLNEVIQEAGRKSPEFGKSFNRAESLHKALKGQSSIRQVLDKSTDLKKLLDNPIAKTVAIGAGTYFGGGAGALSTVPATYVARLSARAFDFLRQPEARNLYFKLVDDVFEGNKANIANSLKRLNDEANKFDQENPEHEDQKIGKVLKGGRKTLGRKSL